jgi:hypothetical protein
MITSSNEYIITSDAITTNTVTFTPIAGTVWIVNAVYIEFVSQAGGTNRVMSVVIEVGGTPTLEVSSRTVQAGGVTNQYVFTGGFARETASTNGVNLTTLPPRLVVPAGHDLIIGDRNNTNAADTMQVSVHYELQNNLES